MRAVNAATNFADARHSLAKKSKKFLEQEGSVGWRSAQSNLE